MNDDQAANFPIVGLGASAGGLEALEAFFDHMPPDSGLAFVVVTHLHPDHKSALPELLRRHSAMPVVHAEDGSEVEQNHVYVAPPASSVTLAGNTLRLGPRSDRAPHMPVDAFFRSLGASRGDRAVAVVLSGTGTDGTLGVKEIKGAGGMVMAQDHKTARYDAMPRSAVAAEVVDYVLPPEQMPERLAAYVAAAFEIEAKAPPALRDDSRELGRIFTLLRSKAGHDFSAYKVTTVRRRIERRMSVHHLEDAGAYVELLQQNPAEIDLLFRELLIGVTSFFRDPEAFESLAGQLDELLSRRPDGHVVRVWVPGCSTGEEAYSIAIVLREAMERLGRHFGVQIFGTDLDPRAIDVARAGEYPEGIVSDVSQGRLERSFVPHDGGYRVRPELRDALVFAPHNLIGDPPFTRLDLLSCRNLLIYLTGPLQQRLLPVFHHSLSPRGILFLGSSETVGSAARLFEVVDNKHKLFRRREVSAGTYTADFPVARYVRVSAAGERAPTGAGPAQLAERVLLDQLVPPTAVIHERGEVVHIHGRTGRYLEPAPGPQGSSNIFNMARGGLQFELAAAVRRAAAIDGPVAARCSRVKTNGSVAAVDLRVERLREPESMRGLYLVSFSDAPAPPDAEPARLDEPPADRLTELERELRYTRESHQSAIEEIETANEELRSTNEELQSTNEELQSTNEELEISKEELQSLNEELHTLNAELQDKLDALSRANDDMRNLLDASEIATLFLDSSLRIKRFTEQARKIVRLIPSDVGRPVADLTLLVRYQGLVADAEEVLRTLCPRQVEVQAQDGAWYLMRMLPYRTTHNVIDGLVASFVDITQVKSLEASHQRLQHALEQTATTVFLQDASLGVRWVSGRVPGRPLHEVVGMTDEELFGPEQAAALAPLKREVLEQGTEPRQDVTIVTAGRPERYHMAMFPERADDGSIVGVTSVMTRLAADRGRA